MIKEFIEFIMSKLRGTKTDAGGSSAPGVTLAVTAKNFEAEVINSDKPVVALFSATWCPACTRQKPVFEKVARALSASYKFVTIDIDEAPSLKRRYGVTAIPTVGLYKPGTEDGAMTIKRGYHPEDKLKSVIQAAFKS